MLGAEVPLSWRLGAVALRHRCRESPRSAAAGLLGVTLLVLGIRAIPTDRAGPRSTLTVRGPAVAANLDDATHIIVEAGGVPVASADVGPSLGPAASFRLRRQDYTVRAYELSEGRLGSEIGAPVLVHLQRDREVAFIR